MCSGTPTAVPIPWTTDWQSSLLFTNSSMQEPGLLLMIAGFWYQPISQAPMRLSVEYAVSTAKLSEHHLPVRLQSLLSTSDGTANQIWEASSGILPFLYEKSFF